MEGSARQAGSGDLVARFLEGGAVEKRPSSGPPGSWTPAGTAAAEAAAAPPHRSDDAPRTEDTAASEEPTRDEQAAEAWQHASWREARWEGAPYNGPPGSWSPAGAAEAEAAAAPPHRSDDAPRPADTAAGEEPAGADWQEEQPRRRQQPWERQIEEFIEANQLRPGGHGAQALRQLDERAARVVIGMDGGWLTGKIRDKDAVVVSRIRRLANPRKGGRAPPRAG